MMDEDFQKHQLMIKICHNPTNPARTTLHHHREPHIHFLLTLSPHAKDCRNVIVMLDLV